MADWPTIDEVKQVLNVDLEVDNWTVTLDRILASAIQYVKSDRGEWDELLDEPNDALAQAALRMCELIAERPEAATKQSDDPTYLRLMFGNKRRFAIS